MRIPSNLSARSVLVAALAWTPLLALLAVSTMLAPLPAQAQAQPAPRTAPVPPRAADPLDTLFEAAGRGEAALLQRALAAPALSADRRALLRAVEAGQAFPARALRGFAFWLFLAVLFGVLGPALLQLASGAERIEVSLSGDQALMLLLTGLLFFVARLLDEARRLADEHSQIV